MSQRPVDHKKGRKPYKLTPEQRQRLSLQTKEQWIKGRGWRRNTDVP